MSFSNNCCVCLEDAIESMVQFKCLHGVCIWCAKKLIFNGEIKCPMCRCITVLHSPKIDWSMLKSTDRVPWVSMDHVSFRGTDYIQPISPPCQGTSKSAKQRRKRRNALWAMWKTFYGRPHHRTEQNSPQSTIYHLSFMWPILVNITNYAIWIIMQKKSDLWSVFILLYKSINESLY